MLDYSKGKIYKIQCEDGYYYIGSTCNDLRFRLNGHKEESRRERAKNRRLYNHIQDWTRVRIVLLEEYPSENRQQLIRKEDEYIRNHRTDALCLNSIGAVVDLEHRKELVDTYYQKHKEELIQKAKERYERNREQILEKMRQQYAEKKAVKNNSE